MIKKTKKKGYGKKMKNGKLNIDERFLKSAILKNFPRLVDIKHVPRFKFNTYKIHIAQMSSNLLTFAQMKNDT